MEAVSAGQAEKPYVLWCRPFSCAVICSQWRRHASPPLPPPVPRSAHAPLHARAQSDWLESNVERISKDDLTETPTTADALEGQPKTNTKAYTVTDGTEKATGSDIAYKLSHLLALVVAGVIALLASAALADGAPPPRCPAAPPLSHHTAALARRPVGHQAQGHLQPAPPHRTHGDPGRRNDQPQGSRPRLPRRRASRAAVRRRPAPRLVGLRLGQGGRPRDPAGVHRRARPPPGHCRRAERHRDRRCADCTAGRRARATNNPPSIVRCPPHQASSTRRTSSSAPSSRRRASRPCPSPSSPRLPPP